MGPALARCRSRAFAAAVLISLVAALVAAAVTGEPAWLCLFAVVFAPAWLACRLGYRVARPGLWRARAAYARYRRAILGWRDRAGLPRLERAPAYWQGLACWAFEEELYSLLVARGCPAALTRRSGDGGVDVVACVKGSETWVQCKRYRGKVGVPVARELYGVMAREGIERGVIAAPGGFTEGAVSFANQAGIELWDARKLASMA